MCLFVRVDVCVHLACVCLLVSRLSKPHTLAAQVPLHVCHALSCTQQPRVNASERGGSLLTRHTSNVTRHTTHVTRHTSHVTRHTSHVTRHTSHVTRHRCVTTTWASWSCLAVARKVLSLCYCACCCCCCCCCFCL